jgi:hypothetical protein
MDMKSIKAMNALAAVVTGVHCPQTGWWIPETQHTKDPTYMWRGSIMPAVGGRTVRWSLSKPDPAGTFALDRATDSVAQHAMSYSAAQSLWPDCLD